MYHIQMTTFPFSYDGYYNVRERLDNLRHVILDAPDPIIKYDGQLLKSMKQIYLIQLIHKKLSKNNCFQRFFE
jgi:hypothetical protein